MVHPDNTILDMAGSSSTRRADHAACSNVSLGTPTEDSSLHSCPTSPQLPSHFPHISCPVDRGGPERSSEHSSNCAQDTTYRLSRSVRNQAFAGVMCIVVALACKTVLSTTTGRELSRTRLAPQTEDIRFGRRELAERWSSELSKSVKKRQGAESRQFARLPTDRRANKHVAEGHTVVAGVSKTTIPKQGSEKQTPGDQTKLVLRDSKQKSHHRIQFVKGIKHRIQKGLRNEVTGRQSKLAADDYKYRSPANDLHVYTVGDEDMNSTVNKQIAEADRIATIPDDVQMQEETEARLLSQKIANRTARIQARKAIIEKIHHGVFAWVPSEFVSDSNMSIGDDNATLLAQNTTIRFEESDNPRKFNASEQDGIWVWCSSGPDVEDIRWVNGTLKGIGKLRSNETLVNMAAGCVHVDGPGFADEQQGSPDDDEAEDLDDELPHRHWDEPFMTYEPHPSSIGWEKKHWSKKDWIVWGLTGPLITCLFTAFVAYSFGPVAGLGALLVCAVADIATYYWNW